MKVLVVNAGSSSLKDQVLDMENEKLIAKGNCEKIAIGGSFIKYKANGIEKKFEGDLQNHTEALSKVGMIKTVRKDNSSGGFCHWVLVSFCFKRLAASRIN